MFGADVVLGDRSKTPPVVRIDPFRGAGDIQANRVNLRDPPIETLDSEQHSPGMNQFVRECEKTGVRQLPSVTLPRHKRMPRNTRDRSDAWSVDAKRIREDGCIGHSSIGYHDLVLVVWTVISDASQ
jgi:hypothetical protein